MLRSEMSWSKSRGKTSKTKCQAGDHQDQRAVQWQDMLLPDWLPGLQIWRVGIMGYSRSRETHCTLLASARLEFNISSKCKRSGELHIWTWHWSRITYESECTWSQCDELTPVPSDIWMWMDGHRGRWPAMAWRTCGCWQSQSREIWVHHSSPLSSQCYNECAKHITASMAKEIIYHRPTTDPAHLLACLTSTHLAIILRPSTMDMRMKEMLMALIHAWCLVWVFHRQSLHQICYLCCGAMATPDGIVGSGIIEVKCPFVCCEYLFEKAAATKRTLCLQKTQKGLRLTSKHHYNHQVQVHLFVTKAEICDFCCLVSQLHTERIFQTVRKCKT